MDVTTGISTGSTSVWHAITGIWILSPTPTPTRIWYPMYWPVEGLRPIVYSMPAPMVRTADPAAKKS